MGFQAFIFSFVGVAARTYAKHVCHPLDDHKKSFQVDLFAFLKFLLQHGYTITNFMVTKIHFDLRLKNLWLRCCKLQKYAKNC